MKKILAKTSFAEIILILSVILSGAFYEYLSCFLSAVMLIWLTVTAYREKKLKFSFDLTSVSLVLLVVSYLVLVLWAVDRGMAIIGFFKFLPVVLYMLVIMQKDETGSILSHLPYIAALITALTAGLMQIPALSTYFSVSGRLAGSFQYPNSFALFLLVAELILLSKEKLSVVNVITFIVLLFGILYTGSRTVFILTALSNLAMIFIVKKKSVKITIISVAATAVAGVVIYALVSGGAGVFSRLLNISFAESTFVGRLLYFRDALPVILKHPFGTGYLGYYYMQKSAQTGVYSVMFIHNDFMQIMLDVGWIPFIVFAAALIRSVAAKSTPPYQKVVIAVIAAHSCFDFDLQFICLFMLLILFMKRGGKERELTKKGACAAVCGAAAAMSVYIGVSLALSSAGKYEAAQTMYPLNTQNEYYMLLLEKDVGKAVKLSDDILKRNEYITLAYSIKSKEAYSNGDFGSVIKYKNLAFSSAPFEYSEYEEYCYMLITGIELYQKEGDTNSADICKSELIKAVSAVHGFKDKLSRFGKMIADQPTDALPDDIEKYVKNISG